LRVAVLALAGAVRTLASVLRQGASPDALSPPVAGCVFKAGRPYRAGLADGQCGRRGVLVGLFLVREEGLRILVAETGCVVPEIGGRSQSRQHPQKFPQSRRSISH